MEMASIVKQYYSAFLESHNKSILPSHLKALNAITRCRTSQSGELYVKCSKCDHGEWRPLSCGNRNCPKCQNHAASQWIEQQKMKLLPVPYFLVTFTIPYELRSLVWHNQKTAYSLLFTTVSSTLATFGKNRKGFKAELGMTMVLHTHSRRLNFHPHIHAVIPAGGIDKKNRQWKAIKGKYLFHHESLAKVFRARFLEELENAGLLLPKNLPKEWVVGCTPAGKGISAVKYLSRYLYRGVISEKNIVSNRDGYITFRFINSETKAVEYRKLKGEDFLWLIVQHVLPKGFRRVRDYGFLHSNAKKLRSLVQLILQMVLNPPKPRTRPVFTCTCCQSAMIVFAFRNTRAKPG